MNKLNWLIFPLLWQCQLTQAPSMASETDQVLSAVITTDRISSNHFCDTVLDEDGNSYLATFVKQPTGEDHLAILKLSPRGEVVWQLGKGQAGRATAISRSPGGDLWVTGFFAGRLELGGATLSAPVGNRIFLARLDADGHCTALIGSEGDGLAFNIHVNSRGGILLNGTMGQSLAFGDVRLRQAAAESAFLALFSAGGEPQWIRPLQGDVHRMASDEEGRFYLTGRFHDHFHFGTDTLLTSGSYDSDGFLLALDPGREVSWVRQFGRMGTIRYGYRTQEAGLDLIVRATDEIIVAAYLDPQPTGLEQLGPRDETLADLALLTFDGQGRLLRTETVVEHVLGGVPVAFVEDARGRRWLAGIGKDYIKPLGRAVPLGERQLFLFARDASGRPDTLILPEHGPNTMIRAANAGQAGLVFTGHFQQYLQAGDQRITNDGRHGIFYWRTGSGDQ
ncbi:MAG: hypothetical protein KDC54_21885 [Lewinella sp.]|nr:hypothetical protein [Lewinella sp.]